jgi:hypothetical protein
MTSPRHPDETPKDQPVPDQGLESRLITVVHEKASRASTDTAFVLGQIIEQLGLSEKYREYALSAGSKPVSLKDLH